MMKMTSDPRFSYDPHVHFQKHGRIEVITGPMFAGKTEEAMRRLKRHAIAKKNCLFIKHETDTRYNDASDCPSSSPKVISKSKYAWNGDTTCCTDIRKVFKRASGYDVVAVDEGQFFESIASFSDGLAEKGVIVIVTYLQSSFQRTPMGEMAQLFCQSHITQLFSVCPSCGSDKALFTTRTSDVPLKGENDLVDMGGEEKYSPSCRICFQ